MISRRNYFSIIMMMAALLFMFQFSQIIKENDGNYDTNEYASENPLSGKGQWKDTSFGGGNDLYGSGAVFVGDAGGSVGRTVAQWCNYTKRKLKAADSISEIDITQAMLPEMILIDSGSVDFDKEAYKETQALERLAQSGINIIFCNLPPKEALQSNDALRELLGITKVYGENAQLEGVHLFSDFLLGGEAVYKAQNPGDMSKQDLNLSVPWYVTGKGTKTYMVGMPDENKFKREDFPGLIWRHSYEDVMIFAVNGEYLNDITGLGILDAMVYEMSDYSIYPVVNAQNVTVVDFPVLAAENPGGMEEVYSRSPEAVMRDVMWPGITSMSLRNKLKLTCCINTKYNYMDDAQPKDGELTFYLKQMREIGAEAGMSFGCEGIAFEDKIAADREFYDSVESGYRLAAAYVDELPGEPDILLDEDGGFAGIRTIAYRDGRDLPVLSYYNDEVTLQQITGDAGEYTYSMDLRMRSLATALGYSNTVINMHGAMWPEDEKDQWEIYFDNIFSNVSTYWTKYRSFEYTALSESDTRVRSFLNLDYYTERDGNRITLYTKGGQDGAWFVLRTHGEAVTAVENGSFERLEACGYLIHTESGQTDIRLGKDKDVLEYSGAFAK